MGFVKEAKANKHNRSNQFGNDESKDLKYNFNNKKRFRDQEYYSFKAKHRGLDLKDAIEYWVESEAEKANT